VLISFLSRGAQTHQYYLVGHIHAYNPELWQRFAVVNSSVISGFSSNVVPSASFLTLIYGEVQHQALLMAFVDNFRLIAILFFVMSPVVFLMRRPQQLLGSASAH
jgi:DHA2 family multidrug resistance protein